MVTAVQITNLKHLSNNFMSDFALHTKATFKRRLYYTEEETLTNLQNYEWFSAKGI